MSTNINDEWDWDGNSSCDSSPDEDEIEVDNLDKKQSKNMKKDNIRMDESNGNQIQSPGLSTIENAFHLMDSKERDKTIADAWDKVAESEMDNPVEMQKENINKFISHGPGIDISRNVFEIYDHTLRTPFEHLQSDFMSLIKEKLIPIVSEYIHKFQKETLNQFAEKWDFDTENEKWRSVLDCSTNLTGASQQLNTWNQELFLFKVEYLSVSYDCVLVLPMNQEIGWNKIIDTWMNRSSIMDSSPPITADILATTNQFPSNLDPISYTFSMFDTPFVVLRPKLQVNNDNYVKSTVRDFISCWQCSIIEFLHKVKNEKSVDPTSIWIHLPFFCPSSQLLEYRGIQYLNLQRSLHYKCELFTHVAKRWGSKSNLFSNIKKKYSQIQPWLDFFPYFVQMTNTTLKEFLNQHQLYIHVQLTHELENELLYWDQILSDTKLYHNNMNSTESYSSIPFLEIGSLSHPLDAVFISAQWNKFHINDFILDTSDINSNLFKLDKLSGWEVRIQTVKDSETELSNTLYWFKDITVAAIVEGGEKHEFDQSFDNNGDAFRVLSSTIQTLSPLVSHNDLSIKEKDAIKNLLLNQVFGLKMDPGAINFLKEESHFTFNMGKSFPPNSLLSLLSLELSHLESLTQIKFFWKLFVMALHELWETKKPIPNIFDNSPNWNYSIIHQKLQLLNYCITYFNESIEKQKNTVKEDPKDFNAIDDINTDTDDEFVDARSGSDTEEENEEAILSKYENSRRGVSHPLKPCTYLKHVQAQIMVPITQEAVPCTEDKIIEQQVLFSKLGTSKEASRIRQSMQSNSLKSDMEAFKAANPDCCFEDFLKWYSPRDVEESLSRRMSNENMWQEIWKEALPVPVSDQKPLFDVEKEAELILNYFESIPLHTLLREVFLYLMINGFFALHRVVEDLVPHIPFLHQSFQKLQKSIRSVSTNPKSEELYTDICSQFQRLERAISIILAISYQIGSISLETIPEEMRIHYFAMLAALCTNQQFIFHLESGTDQNGDDSTLNNTRSETIARICKYFISQFVSNPESDRDATHKEYVLQCIDTNNMLKQMRISISGDSLRVSSIS